MVVFMRCDSSRLLLDTNDILFSAVDLLTIFRTAVRGNQGASRALLGVSRGYFKRS